MTIQPGSATANSVRADSRRSPPPVSRQPMMPAPAAVTRPPMRIIAPMTWTNRARSMPCVRGTSGSRLEDHVEEYEHEHQHGSEVEQRAGRGAQPGQHLLV